MDISLIIALIRLKTSIGLRIPETHSEGSVIRDIFIIRILYNQTRFIPNYSQYLLHISYINNILRCHPHVTSSVFLHNKYNKKIKYSRSMSQNVDKRFNFCFMVSRRREIEKRKSQTLQRLPTFHHNIKTRA